MKKQIITITILLSIISFQAMFIENTFLLLASSWMFSMVSWDTVGIPAAVFCSFLIGEEHCHRVHDKFLESYTLEVAPWVGGSLSKMLTRSASVFSKIQVEMQMDTSRSSGLQW